MSDEQIKDLACFLVNGLVIDGLIPDCTDTDDDTEFEFQDAIEELLIKRRTNGRL
jgi:agmatine/peptidylarginine deiminase